MLRKKALKVASEILKCNPSPVTFRDHSAMYSIILFALEHAYMQGCVDECLNKSFTLDSQGHLIETFVKPA
jgi:hypothetical protein